MQLPVQNPEFSAQRLMVEPARLSSGPSLFLNGVKLKGRRRAYLMRCDSGLELLVKMKYNYLDPFPKLTIRDEIVLLASPLKWYEYLCIGIPFTLVFIGGAIGGLCGGVGAAGNGRIFRSERNLFVKIGLSS